MEKDSLPIYNLFITYYQFLRPRRNETSLKKISLSKILVVTSKRGNKIVYKDIYYLQAQAYNLQIQKIYTFDDSNQT